MLYLISNNQQFAKCKEIGKLYALGRDHTTHSDQVAVSISVKLQEEVSLLIKFIAVLVI